GHSSRTSVPSGRRPRRSCPRSDPFRHSETASCLRHACATTHEFHSAPLSGIFPALSRVFPPPTTCPPRKGPACHHYHSRTSTRSFPRRRLPLLRPLLCPQKFRRRYFDRGSSCRNR